MKHFDFTEILRYEKQMLANSLGVATGDDCYMDGVIRGLALDAVANKKLRANPAALASFNRGYAAGSAAVNNAASLFEAPFRRLIVRDYERLWQLSISEEQALLDFAAGCYAPGGWDYAYRATYLNLLVDTVKALGFHIDFLTVRLDLTNR